MRPLLLVPALVLLACTPQVAQQRLPPSNALYFPTGLVFKQDPVGPEGFVYVASANFDRRFDYGTISAIDMSKLAGSIPPFGTRPANNAPTDLIDLKLEPTSQVLVQSFAGEMVGYQVGDSFRLFTPARGEGDYLHILEGRTSGLSCAFPGPSAQDCTSGSPSLTALERVGTGKPRAPEPIGVGISDDGEVFVTHIRGADSPVGSATNIEAYVVQVNGNKPGVTADNFISLGLTGGTNSVAVGKRWAFVTGRYISPRGYLVRLVDRTRALPVYNPALENIYKVLEARGVALTRDERRLFVAGRSPDTLLVIDVQNASSDAPVLTVVRGVPLPTGANAVKIIERPGRGSLVVITSSNAGVVSVYDDDLGQIVAQIVNAGVQPFAVDVQRRGSGVRMYVSAFGEGRVGVVDMPDVNAPQQTYTVARLGLQQICQSDSTNAVCPQPPSL